MTSTRRSFLRSAALAAGGLAAPPAALRAQESAAASGRRLALGFDNFSVRDLGWKADRLVEYAAELGCDCVLFSDLDVYESHEAAYLADLRQKAADLGLTIFAGTGGINPHAHRFSDKWGTAEEHLALAIRVARDVGSPAVRCYQGFFEDRRSEGGIRARMAETVELLKSVRSVAEDAGVKIAVENHAGDMQARELRDLIEAAGPEFVGATIDSGNATWTLEDPLSNLETLAPYAACAGIRGSMVWENDEGAVVQWTAIREGNVDMKKYAARWAELCPDVPFILEIISGFARPFPYYRKDFWEPYKDVRAVDFVEFVKLARSGEPIDPFAPADGEDPAEARRNYQRAQLEQSVKFCREQLGLGRRGRE